MECKLCGSTKFRVSRLRVPDLSELIFLHYPVRCRVCYKREYVNFLTAFRIRRTNKRRQEEERRRKKIQQAKPARQA
jgi:hypothetical protein